MKEMYRQGDVLFKRITKLPKGEQNVRANGHILEGETTGHVHRLGTLDTAEVIECGGGLFLSVGLGGVSIVHEEHKPLVLPPGDYEITRQREYTPEAIRNVMD